MTYWQNRLTIGALSVPRFLGAPLDKLTDEPFRLTTRLFCPDALLYSEIRHVAAVVNMPANKLQIDARTRPINFQMTAGSTDYIADACARVQEMGVDAIDINIGCPAPHIVKSGAGSALMADIDRLSAVINMFRAHVKLPLTVKMRAGFKEMNADRVARLCQDAGVDAIVVHPRLQKEFFKGTPRYDMLASLKQNLSIPLIVSGGITCYADAVRVYQQTGIDGFLIGRAQLGAPWLLRQLQVASMQQDYTPDGAAMVMAIKHHMHALQTFYGQRGLPLARRHLGWYVHARKGAGQVRAIASKASSWQALHELVDNLVERLLQ